MIAGEKWILQRDTNEIVWMGFVKEYMNELSERVCKGPYSWGKSLTDHVASHLYDALSVLKFV